MFGNVYCPISHGIKVGFSVLSSHISEINRAAGGAGWGLGFGSDLKSPLCCYVVVLSFLNQVLANDYYITVKYQLNTLQLFNSKGTWNQAEYSPKKYYFNKSAPNKKSASYMCGFIEEAMTLDQFINLLYNLNLRFQSLQLGFEILYKNIKSYNEFLNYRNKNFFENFSLIFLMNLIYILTINSVIFNIRIFFQSLLGRCILVTNLFKKH